MRPKNQGMNEHSVDAGGEQTQTRPWKLHWPSGRAETRLWPAGPLLPGETQPRPKHGHQPPSPASASGVLSEPHVTGEPILSPHWGGSRRPALSTEPAPHLPPCARPSVPSAGPGAAEAAVSRLDLKISCRAQLAYFARVIFPLHAIISLCQGPPCPRDPSCLGPSRDPADFHLKVKSSPHLKTAPRTVKTARHQEALPAGLRRGSQTSPRRLTGQADTEPPNSTPGLRCDELSCCDPRNKMLASSTRSVCLLSSGLRAAARPQWEPVDSPSWEGRAWPRGSSGLSDHSTPSLHPHLILPRRAHPSLCLTLQHGDTLWPQGSPTGVPSPVATALSPPGSE